MRTLRTALVVWAAVAVWAWTFGPVGFVAGGAAFLGGWAIGHRSGRNEATVEAARRIRDYYPVEAFAELDRRR